MCAWKSHSINRGNMQFQILLNFPANNVQTEGYKIKYCVEKNICRQISTLSKHNLKAVGKSKLSIR